jgi:hypothetical protein
LEKSQLTAKVGPRPVGITEERAKNCAVAHTKTMLRTSGDIIPKTKDKKTEKKKKKKKKTFPSVLGKQKMCEMHIATQEHHTQRNRNKSKKSTAPTTIRRNKKKLHWFSLFSK